MAKVNRRARALTATTTLLLATLPALVSGMRRPAQPLFSVFLAAGLSLVPRALAFMPMRGRGMGAKHPNTWRRTSEEPFPVEDDALQVPRSRKATPLQSYGFVGRVLPRTHGKQRYVDELSKSELFTRLKEKGNTHHDDVVIRSSRGGRQLSIPQAERYRSSDW